MIVSGHVPTMTPSQVSRISYRPDIDGLRAIAVLAVVGFHASPRFVPGGFVGVDIFFVISGFLISGILFAQVEQGRFDLAEFYTRRIRRIFPALVVVLAACWVMGWFALVQDEYIQLEKHVAGASAFVANFIFWNEAGYFDAPSGLKPLLHLWSLGIEEQFYLIWPPLIYFWWKRGLNFVSLIVSIIVVSFLLNVLIAGQHAETAFYLPHTRIWELLLGSALAYVECFRHEPVDSFVNRMVFASPAHYDERSVANLKAWVGLSLIFLAVLGLDKGAAFPGWWAAVPGMRPFVAVVGLDQGTIYPGWWALLPTLGTGLLIWAGAAAWVNRAILNRRALVYLGLISYPLYLWHWPLLSYLEITESGHASRALRAYAVALAFLLAWLTYVAIERPIRRTVRSKAQFGRLAPVAIALLLIGSLSFWAANTNAWTSRKPVFATEVDPRFASPRHDAQCSQQFPTDGEYCQQYASGVKVTTALLGDSHAEHFLPGVGAYLSKRGENVVHLGESGCPPLLDVERFLNGQRDTCRAANNSVLDYVGKTGDLSKVVLSFRGAATVSGKVFGTVEGDQRVVFRIAGTSLSPEDSMRVALERTVDYLVQKHKQVWLILQVPELGFDIRECAGRPFSFEQKIRNPCAVPKADVLGRQALYRQIVSEVRQKIPSLQVFDPLQYLCDERSCSAIVDGRLLYRDSNHLSRAGSLFFADKFTF